MQYLKLFEDFVETPRNVEVLYQDDNLVVKVAKTFDAVKQLNVGTQWCSSAARPFYVHNRTANMYRIEYKDGYKLRLTWDYISQKASELGAFSGGTHWGQGGTLNGEELHYDVFRPRDESDPFEIDWQSEKRREIVERIKALPDDAKLAMMQYQEKASRQKSENLNKLYKEIEQIKVVDVKRAEEGSRWYDQIFDVTISYRGKQYKIRLNHNSKENFFFRLGNFAKDFKNRYFQYGREMSKYLYDKTMEYIKNHDLDII